MLTMSRIFTALAGTCTGVLTFAGAEALPTWARIVIGAIGLFSGGLVATQGPIQNTANENKVAKGAVAFVKGNS